MTLKVFCAYYPRSVKCQRWIYLKKTLHSAKSPLGKSTRGNSTERTFEIILKRGDNLLNHTAIADNRAKTHRLFCRTAYLGSFAFAYFHARQFCRALKKIIAHQWKARRNNTAAPAQIRRDNSRCESCAEIHHYYRRSVAENSPCRVSEPIGADRLGLWVRKLKRPSFSFKRKIFV